MFRIEENDILCKKHYKNLKERLNYRINKLDSYEVSHFCGKSEKVKEEIAPIVKTDLVKLKKELGEWLKKGSNLEKIICSKPQELLKLYIEIKDIANFKMNGSVEAMDDEGVNSLWLCKVFNYIFPYDNYDIFTKEMRYELTHELDVNICPYCNRAFTNTVMYKAEEDDYVLNPEIDHYFSQSAFPMFRLSFYNLIPSCSNCNGRIKNDKELSLDKHLHPYAIEEKRFSFHMDYKKTMSDGKIRIITDFWDDKGNLQKNSNHLKVEATTLFFKLEKIYQCHKDEVELLEKIYNELPKSRLEDEAKKMSSKIAIADKLTVKEAKQLYIKYKETMLHNAYSHFIVKDPEKEILGHLRNDLYQWIMTFYR